MRTKVSIALIIINVFCFNAMAEHCALSDAQADNMTIAEALSGNQLVRKDPNNISTSYIADSVKVDFSKYPLKFDRPKIDDVFHDLRSSEVDDNHPVYGGSCHAGRMEINMRAALPAINISGVHELSSWNANSGNFLNLFFEGLQKNSSWVNIGCKMDSDILRDGVKVKELPASFREMIMVPCTRIRIQEVDLAPQFRNETTTSVM